MSTTQGMTEKEVIIAASQERIWDALTYGKSTEPFWQGYRVECDWQVGSMVLFYNSDSPQPQPLQAKVHALQAPNSLSLDWGFVSPLNQQFVSVSRVSYQLQPVSAGRVRLGLRHTRLSEKIPEAEALFMQLDKGWPQVLKSLKQFLENGSVT